MHPKSLTEPTMKLTAPTPRHSRTPTCARVWAAAGVTAASANNAAANAKLTLYRNIIPYLLRAGTTPGDRALTSGLTDAAVNPVVLKLVELLAAAPCGGQRHCRVSTHVTK